MFKGLPRDVIQGQWTEREGLLEGTGNTAVVFAPVPWSPSGEAGCSNCTIEADMEIAGGNSSKVMLEGWYQNNSNKVELIMNEEKNRWILKQRAGGVVVAKAKAASTIQPGSSYEIVLSFDGSNFRLSVNGASILTMRAGAVPSGKVGFKVKRTVGSFGNIRVY